MSETTLQVVLVTEADIQWLQKKLRDEFDAPRSAHEKAELVDIMERAERLGLHALADDMMDDIRIEFGPIQKEEDL